MGLRARRQVAKIEEDMASVNSKLSERKDILVHTELAAPVPGVVKPVFKAFGGAFIER
jgi:hypothetical protein